ncbi:hypothetical protein ACO0QE_003187 [Hanseniaspora vineae]
MAENTRNYTAKILMQSEMSNPQKFDEDTLQAKLENFETILYKTLKTQDQAAKLFKALKTEHQTTYTDLINFINSTVITNEQDFGRTLELNKTSLSSILSNFHSTLKSNKYEKNYQISTKINDILTSLTTEFESVQSTYNYLNNLQKIKQKCKQIHQDFDPHSSRQRYDDVKNNKKLLEASQNIRDILTLINNDFEYLNTEFARKIIPTSELPMEPVAFITKTMNDILVINKTIFDQSCEKLYRDPNDNKNLQILQQSFQIFPLINQPKLGLDLYSKYICNIINDKSRDIIVLQKKKLSIPQSFLHLFKMCSMIINNHSQIIIRFYNDDKKSMISIMDNLQKEIDLQSSLILDIFMDKSDLQNKKDEFLSDFLIILGYWSMFQKFFSIKYKEFSEDEDMVAQEESHEQSVTHIPKCLADNQFNTKLNTIINDSFKPLFQKQIKDNLGKVFDIEIMPDLNNYISSFSKPDPQLIDAPVPTSSLTDDFSIICKKYLIIIINSGDFELVDEFMSNFLPDVIIKELFIKIILNKLADLSITPTYLSKYTDSVEKIGTRGSTPTPQHENQSGLINTRDYVMKSAFSSIQQYANTIKGSTTSNIVKEVFSNKQIVADEYTTDIGMHHFHTLLIYMNTIQALKVVLEKLLVEELIHGNNILPTNFIFEKHADAVAAKIKNAYDTTVEYCDLILRNYASKVFEIGWKQACQSLGKLLLNGKHNFIQQSAEESNQSQKSISQAYFCNAADLEDLGTLADFIKFWNIISQPYKNVCDSKFYSLILSFVIDYINKSVLLPKFWSLQKVNELGALKLDKEISLFISTVCSSDHYYLREKFNKLNQLILVLGFEMEDFTTNKETGMIELKAELKDSISWCISDEEINKVRKMRV